MKASIFAQTIKIAINRSMLQLTSVVITAILGLYSTDILAEFSLALSFASILFVIVSFLSLGLQAEYSRRYSAKRFDELFSLFWSASLFILVVGLTLMVATQFIPNPFLSGHSTIHFNAYLALKVLVISLPLVGLLTNLCYFLESLGHLGLVTKLRVIQFFVQILLVSFVVVFERFNYQGSYASVLGVVMSYVVSDFLLLVTGCFFLLKIVRNDPMLLAERKQTINSMSCLLKVIQLGVPLMLGIMGQKLIFYCCMNFSATLGVVEVSVFAIINSIVFFTQIPLVGAANLLSLKISHASGMQSGLNVGDDTTTCKKIFLIELGVLFVGLFLFYGLFINLFSDNVAVIDELMHLKPTVALYFIMNASLMFYMAALRGLSDNVIPQFIVLSLLALGLLPWINFFPLQLNLNRMLIIFSLFGLLGALVLYFRCNRSSSIVTLPS